MMTICPGWPATDSVPVHVVPIVLADDGVADGRVSHGMCPACARAMNQDADRSSRHPGESMPRTAWDEVV